MYGRIKKCPEQLEADRQFIEMTDKQYVNHQEGAKAMVALGWQYIARKQVNVAMNRFNQAWLLDSLNEQLAWGFGSALGMQGKNKSSLVFFKVAVYQNAKNNRVWRDAAVSYGNVWHDIKQIAYLDTAVLYLKKSITLNTDEADTYAELAKVYHYYPQADSAKKYLAIADKINPIQVDWRIREMINNK